MPATTTLPNWYKSIPQFINGEKKLRVIPGERSVNSTVKRCTPFLEGMSIGYMLVLSDDVQVLINQQTGLQGLWWRTSSTLVTEHAPEQYPNLHIPEEYSKTVFKWANEWQLETPKGYSLHCSHPSNRLDLPFHTFTGIVDSDRYPLSIQFPFIIKKDFEGILERGTPVAQLLPIKRDSWKSQIEPYQEVNYLTKMRQFFGKIDRAYKNNFWIKKTYQ